MNRRWIAILGLAILLAPGCVGKRAVKTQSERESYGIGVGVARNFQRQGIQVDQAMVIQGMTDVLSNRKLVLNDDELRKTMEVFQANVRQKQTEAAKRASIDNQKAGDAFLAQNKKKAGVVTLPSGLQYEVLKAGDGKKPTDADSVECNYRGTLLDGTEFDSTSRAGHPATLELKRLIPGWQEALTLMPVGSKWRLFVPPALAYGSRGSGAEIGPNATLLFELELLAIK